MDETSNTWLGQLRQREELAWRRFVAVYRPFIGRALGGLGVTDVDDVTGEVMAAVVELLPGFVHQRPGSFRRWLREITRRRAMEHFRRRGAEPSAGNLIDRLDQLADDSSDVSRQWDLDHDRHVLSQALESVRGEFGDKVYAAFAGTGLAGRPASDVAAELSMTPTAVYVARHRVLARVRALVRDIVGEGDL